LISAKLKAGAKKLKLKQSLKTQLAGFMDSSIPGT